MPRHRHQPQPPPPLSVSYSTPGVQNSFWCSVDFMLGAGMVLIQENTHKIVTVYDTQKKRWFLPRGSKNVGESLEQAALREAYEESGYRAELIPLFSPHLSLAPLHDQVSYDSLNIEPIFVSLASWRSGQRGPPDNGGEYLTMWYVGRIAENAVRKIGTGMPDEQNYQSYLLPVDDAIDRLSSCEKKILLYGWEIYGFHCH